MTTTTTDLLAEARRIADVTLFEGYVLYPYRASAAKNQLRWQFGVLTPPAWADAHAERSASRTECLAELTGPRPTLSVQVRFLHAARRIVERAERTGFVAVDALELSDRLVVPFDDAEVREVDLHASLADLSGAGLVREVSVPGGSDTELLCDAGSVVGRLSRTWHGLRLVLRIRTEAVPGPFGAVRLVVVVANTTPYDGTPATREEALRRSLVAAHVLLGLADGRFISLLDPPEWAAPAAAACTNDGSWPVLVGGEDRREVVLASPIILYDYPQLAPESAGELYDATEIDEILTLRTLALTDEEKRQARGTDPRAAEVVDRVDAMPPEVLERLHGAVRSLRRLAAPVEPRAATPPHVPPGVPWWDPGADSSVSPDTDTVVVSGVAVGKGSTVEVHPLRSRADAQDLFLEGRRATVEAVLRSVDDEFYLAVTLDDDEAADLARSHGRFLYFRPDEVDPA